MNSFWKDACETLIIEVLTFQKRFKRLSDMLFYVHCMHEALCNCLVFIEPKDMRNVLMLKTNTKQIQEKMVKSLLDIIVLQLLNSQPMHGYQIISSIRKIFGVYLGPSTIYPFLCNLEKNKYIKSSWDMSGDRPKKVYTLTAEGRDLLNYAEDSLNIIRRKVCVGNIQDITLTAQQ
ncbi:MAG: PadR family transcriptional regulator [Candidatus Bathyarchaeia archaeon]